MLLLPLYSLSLPAINTHLVKIKQSSHKNLHHFYKKYWFGTRNGVTLGLGNKNAETVSLKSFGEDTVTFDKIQLIKLF